MAFKINEDIICIDNTNLKGFVTDGAIYRVKSVTKNKGVDIVEIQEDKKNRHFVIAKRFKKYQTLYLPAPKKDNECKLSKPSCDDCRECLKKEHFDELSCAYD